VAACETRRMAFRKSRQPAVPNEVQLVEIEFERNSVLPLGWWKTTNVSYLSGEPDPGSLQMISLGRTYRLDGVAMLSTVTFVPPGLPPLRRIQISTFRTGLFGQLVKLAEPLIRLSA
jgi:hypothetical protein